MKSTGEQEMLLNLVRMRYDETPYFLTVGSITSQLSADVNAGWDAEVENTIPRYFSTGRVSLGDRPTVSYAPQLGTGFARALLTPLSLANMALLLESGWDLKRLLRLTVAHANGVENATSAGGPTPGLAPEYASFRYVGELVSSLNMRRVGDLVVEKQERVVGSLSESEATVSDMVNAASAGFRVDKRGDSTALIKSERVLTLKINPQFMDDPELAQLQALLHLRPGLEEYPLVFESGGYYDALTSPTGIDELRIRTRSMIEMLFYLSQGVVVPEEHFCRGLALATKNPDGSRFDWSDVLGDLFVIRSSKHRPKHKLAVNYRDYWFYIADNDHRSKRMLLTLLNVAFLEKVNVDIEKPVLTIPL